MNGSSETFIAGGKKELAPWMARDIFPRKTDPWLNRHPMIFTLDPKSERAQGLASVDEDPVLPDSDGVRYTVNRAEDDELWADYDPERVRAAAWGGSSLIWTC